MRYIPFAALTAAITASQVAAAASEAGLEKRIFNGDSKFVFECSQQIIPGKWHSYSGSYRKTAG